MHMSTNPHMAGWRRRDWCDGAGFAGVGGGRCSFSSATPAPLPLTATPSLSASLVAAISTAQPRRAATATTIAALLADSHIATTGATSATAGGFNPKRSRWC